MCDEALDTETETLVRVDRRMLWGMWCPVTRALTLKSWSRHSRRGKGWDVRREGPGLLQLVPGPFSAPPPPPIQLPFYSLYTVQHS